MKRITEGFDPSFPWLRASEMLLSAVRGWGPIFEAKLAGSDSNRVLQLFQQKATTFPLYVVVMFLTGSPLTGQVSLTGFPWAQAAPALSRRTAATLKVFIPRSLSDRFVIRPNILRRFDTASSLGAADLRIRPAGARPDSAKGKQQQKDHGLTSFA